MKKIVAMCLMGVATISCVDEQRITASESEMLGPRFQLAVDGMKALHKDLEWPKHWQGKEASRRGDEFDVRRYFSVLTHISMEDGYVLDYVYDFGVGAGDPLLYARPSTQPSYATSADFKESIRKEAHLDEIEAANDEYWTATTMHGTHQRAREEALKTLGERLAQFPDSDYENWYLKHIRVDGTKEGFLEYIALHLLGGQFYLYWHACYDDTRIIASRSGLRRLLDEQTSSGPSVPMTSALRAKAMRIDCSPIVEIGEKETIVSIVTFTKWGGFFRQRFVVRTGYPHKIVNQTSDNLVPYDCGIQF